MDSQKKRYRLVTVPNSINTEHSITIEPITWLMRRMPLESNFPLTLSISHVNPYHHTNAPATILMKPTNISKGWFGMTKANWA